MIIKKLKYFMQNVRVAYPDVLSQDEVDAISNNLTQYVGNDESVKLAHLESIRKKVEAPYSCPWCGANLVVRTAKKGPNPGNQFYGCSNYPKCRYTRNIH